MQIGQQIVEIFKFIGREYIFFLGIVNVCPVPNFFIFLILIQRTFIIFILSIQQNIIMIIKDLRSLATGIKLSRCFHKPF